MEQTSRVVWFLVYGTDCMATGVSAEWNGLEGAGFSSVELAVLLRLYVKRVLVLLVLVSSKERHGSLDSRGDVVLPPVGGDRLALSVEADSVLSVEVVGSDE